MEAGLDKASVLRFANYELDLTNRQLRRNGVPIDLQPQALAILSLLASRPNTLVTRIEIQGKVWPTEPFSDIQSRLYFQIKSIRQALGDDPESPSYVQTVPKSGYKFIAPVQMSHPSELEPAGLNSGDKKTQSILRSRKLAVVLIGALCLAISAGLVALLVAARNSGKESRVSAETAAVQSSRSDNAVPVITSITPILPKAIQKIVLSGRNLGSHTPFVNLDTPFLAIRDNTADWAAGRMTPENSDEVTLSVESWTDAQIVVAGFSGAYGSRGWKLAPGDGIEVAVWNPQTGNGPALYTLRVSAVESAK